MRLDEIRKRLETAQDNPATFTTHAQEDMTLLLAVVEGFAEVADYHKQQEGEGKDDPQLAARRTVAQEKLNSAIDVLLADQ